MKKPSPSASPDFTVRDFFARFPSEAVCLEHIMAVRYGGTLMDCPACGAESQYHKLHDRRVYACPHCLHQIAPTANTILHDTRTPLVSWFFAMYLFCTTRHGVSGKELQRQLGVTYKTAWRMGQQIRDLMARADGFVALRGHVEMDEAYVGGRRPRVRGRGALGKTVVFGMKQRGGRIVTETVPDARTATLKPIVLDTVEPGTKISTDEWPSYDLLTSHGYEHGQVKHSKKEYVRGEHHVNNVESFWNLFKNSVRGTHIHISAKHMQRYLGEFTFRSNHRAMGNAMFDLLVGAL